ncbi:hypothetical protein [Pseudocitrobacter faecalis]|uniref:hypothetical protein n=1 Tax=Pseudocitrobacter faecalis TaxID=1398493 RepID=UPI003BA344AD
MRKLLLLLFMYSMSTSALEYQWPVLVSANATNTSLTMTYTVSTYNDPTISDTSTLIEVAQAKLGTLGAAILVAQFIKWNGGTCTYTDCGSYIALPNVQYGTGQHINNATVQKLTFKDYAADLIKAAGTSTYNNLPWKANMGCLFMTTGVESISDFSNAPWSSLEALPRWNPGGGLGCVGLPPAPEWCALATPSLTYAFGTMQLANAPGSSLTEELSVQCTAGVKYTLDLVGNSEIDLSNGMKAIITADSSTLGSTLNGVEGINRVPLTATLSGTPTTSGAFSGAGILFVSYP